MSDEPSFMQPPSLLETREIWLIEARPAGSTDDSAWGVLVPVYAHVKRTFIDRAVLHDAERMPEFEFRAKKYGPTE